MDKNTLTGFILIAAVLIGFSYFSRPSEAEMEAQRRQQDSIAMAQQKRRWHKKPKKRQKSRIRHK